MITYYVRTPNPQFAGKLCGVKFADGRALVDERTIDPQVLKGRTVDDIARQLVEEHRCECDPSPRQAQPVKEPPAPVVKHEGTAKRTGEYKAG